MLEHAKEIFILFIVPLLGLVIDFYLSKKITLYILIFSLILLIPVFTEYNYVVHYVYPILSLIIFACAYSFYSRQIERKTPKIITSFIISSLLFIILGFIAFLSIFIAIPDSDFIQVVDRWDAGEYRVDHVRNDLHNGISRYELSKFSIIPIFIKKIDIKEEVEYIPDWEWKEREKNRLDCNIVFEKSNIVFNRCDRTIKQH